MPDEELTGTVKWFDNAKGFGFIAPDGAEKDIFVHYSDILQEGFKTLHEGERVSFIPFMTPKGPQAGQVRKIEVQMESPDLNGPPGEREAPPPLTAEPYRGVSEGEVEGLSMAASGSAASPDDREEPQPSADSYPDEPEEPSFQGF